MLHLCLPGSRWLPASCPKTLSSADELWTSAEGRGSYASHPCAACPAAAVAPALSRTPGQRATNIKMKDIQNGRETNADVGLVIGFSGVPWFCLSDTWWGPGPSSCQAALRYPLYRLSPSLAAKLWNAQWTPAGTRKKGQCIRNEKWKDC